jgi:uncharacterized protein YkwD
VAVPFRDRDDRHGVRRPVLPALLVALVALCACIPNPAERASIVAATNEQRVAAGLAPLPENQRLNAAAQVWADLMAQDRKVRHSPSALRQRVLPTLVPDWRWLGENVGSARELEELPPAFLRSPAHAAVLLNERADVIGVGAAQGGDGRWYVAVLFVDLPAAVRPA